MGAGELDPTFNGAGVVRTGFGGANDTANAVASQSSGKIVAVGPAGDHFGVIRYNQDGSLDLTFGGTGKVVTVFGSRKSVATAVRIQNDGKIVVAGYAGTFFETAFAVARYNPDGSLDPTFDGDGKVTTVVRGVSDRAFAVAIQGDGKIVVAGEAATFGGDYDFALVRYLPDGSLDPSFDGDGRVISVIGPEQDRINAITLYGDKIIVAGFARIGTNNAFAVARYNSDGSFDTTFNTSGKIFPAVGEDDGAYGVAIQNGNGSILQPDKLVVAGQARVGSSYVFAALRLNLDNGSLDMSFDGDGKATALITGQDFGRGLVVQGGGITPRKIVVAGYSFAAGVATFSAVRFNLDGSLDSTFDGDGKFSSPVGPKTDLAQAIVLQSSGKYVLAGSSANGADADFGLLRCDSNGTLDPTFDGDGKRTDNVGDLKAPAESIVIQPDRKIIAAGGSSQLRLARYNPDGSLDASFGVDGKSSIPLGIAESGRSIALQSDGKVVAAGYVFVGGMVKPEVIRCLADGSLDLSFDGDGRASVVLSQSALGTAVAVQPDGKILIAGYVESPVHSFVARFESTGAPDISFAGTGVVATNLGNGAQVRALALQADGRILVAGNAGQDFLVCRYDSDGSLDNSFDDDGVATVSLSASSDVANALAIQPDGRIVLAGTSFDTVSNQNRFGVARFLSSGAPDISLGGSGKLTTAIGSGSSSGNAVTIQPDGKILVAGATDGGVDRGTDLAVVRYNSDGSIDGSYGDAGKVVLDPSSGNDTANGTALDDLGRLVLSGDSGDVFGVVRLTMDFVPPPTPTPTPTPGVVANVATRLPVGTGDNVLIEGFIVLGPNGSTKKIMVRALGPFLTQFGVPDALANPTLEIRDGTNTVVATNNDWRNTQVGGIVTSDQEAEIEGSNLAPTNDLESAIIANLAPGNYTAVVSGVNNTVGTGIVDAYDMSPASPARLANIATRGLIQPGDQLMIAGFIIQSGDVRAVIRAIGPSLSAFGIDNALSDTTLQLRDVNGAIVRENDDWQSHQKVELEATGLQPGNSLEAAIVDTIAPGQYTVQVRGKPETTGIGVVEIYFLQ